MNSTSPVDYLIAFGLTFLAGVGSVFAARAYGNSIRKKAKEEFAASSGIRS